MFNLKSYQVSDTIITKAYCNKCQEFSEYYTKVMTFHKIETLYNTEGTVVDLRCYKCESVVASFLEDEKKVFFKGE